jgi:hypothetical protein
MAVSCSDAWLSATNCNASLQSYVARSTLGTEYLELRGCSTCGRYPRAAVLGLLGLELLVKDSWHGGVWGCQVVELALRITLVSGGLIPRGAQRRADARPATVP